MWRALLELHLGEADLSQMNRSVSGWTGLTCDVSAKKWLPRANELLGLMVSMTRTPSSRELSGMRGGSAPRAPASGGVRRLERRTSLSENRAGDLGQEMDAVLQDDRKAL